ncbi:hypothetical protein CPC16_000175 [Podila verticillata]|nr:hypothetical protein CPC16_000175 [Podila verticillata]
MWPMDDFPDINVHSYIGVIIAIVGNILISVALNIQKYAHNQLQPGAVADAKLIQTTPTYIIEEEPFHDTLLHNAPVDDDDDASVHGYQSDNSDHSSRSSHSSSLHGRSHQSSQSETSDQSETLAQRRASLDRYYADPVSDTDYLRSKAWWAGMTLMILGECGNFLAYGYAQASIIAPLGTVALVSNVILAPLMLREPFRSRDLGGIVIAIIGTVVVVVNSKENEIKLTPEAVITALLQTQFIVYFIVCCVLLVILMSLSDTIGPDYIFIDLSIVAIFGGYTVLATKGVSSLLSLSFYKMFTYPIAYLLVFVLVSTAVLQIKFLNKSLQRFDSTQVIPTQFVLFTTSAIVGSAILYNDFDEMDFNKGLHFLTGCCMTFLGVYFITSQRDKDVAVTQAANAEWALSPQQHLARSSMDIYPAHAPLYPTHPHRPELLMEQGQASGNVGYNIPPPNRIRSVYAVPESPVGASIPLLDGTPKGHVPGPRDSSFSITNSVHNVLAAVGARHTSSLGLDKVLENYHAQRIEERRASIHSINQLPNPLPRPGLGSRSSSACSGAFPSATFTNHPSSISLLPPDHTYGSTYQSMHSIHSGQSQPRSNTHDPRAHASHLQERSMSHDGYHQQKQPRRKASAPVLTKENRDSPSLTTISSKEGQPLRIKTVGVAVPVRKGDRHKFPASPSEHEFMAGISQSIDSVTSRHDKSAKYLPTGGLLSSSPSRHPTQGSEYAFQTLKSSVTASSPIINTTFGSILSGEEPAHATGTRAQLPPLPPLSSSVSSSSAPLGPRQKKKHGTQDSVDGLPLAPTKRRDSLSRD